jgi:single-strand DNA-binding protein
MAGVNKIILIGNLEADPEVRYTPSGTAVANFNMATSEQWTDREGQKQSRKGWHRIDAWRRLGEICGEYLHKGKQVYIEGRLQTDSWEDQDGNKRYSTKVVAREMQMLGSADRGQSEQFSDGSDSTQDATPQGGVNKVILLGRLGSDPEVKQIPSGSTVANFSIATSEEWKDKNSGEKQERTEWHRIVAWDKLGQMCGRSLHKGSQVYIEGRVQTRSWEGQDGNKRWTTEIVAQMVRILGAAGKGGRAESTEERFPTEEPINIPEDEIPF